MKAERIEVDRQAPSSHAIARAAGLLRGGELVAFPTETVYGLGADATNPVAVGRIFEAKGRPADNPLIVHIGAPEDLDSLVTDVPPKALRLMRRFWPGALTLVFRKSERVPSAVTCNLPTVAVRMPDDPVALALIRATGRPLAAPSANRSGRPSPTCAEHVFADLGERIAAIVDGGPAGIGVESTVLDMVEEPPVLLRPGGVTVEDLEAEIGPIRIDAAATGIASAGAPRSPGTKYAHYAPQAALTLVEGEPLRVRAKIEDLVAQERSYGKRVGVLCSTENRAVYVADQVVDFGSRDEPGEVAKRLFVALRELDEHNLDLIFAEGLAAEGIGLAVMNRLRRAAGGRLVQA